MSSSNSKFEIKLVGNGKKHCIVSPGFGDEWGKYLPVNLFL